MRRSVLFSTIVLSAILVGLADAHCGVGGCACSDEPNGSCCPGYTCGPQRRCQEVVVERDEFLYPYPYNYDNYGYTEYGVPGYYDHYNGYFGYAGGSTAYGNNYVGYGWGKGSPFLNG